MIKMTSTIIQTKSSKFSKPLPEKSENKYDHYWHVRTGPELLFWYSHNNQWDQEILKVESKSLPQLYFLKQEDDWVKSNMMLVENFMTKIYVTW